MTKLKLLSAGLVAAAMLAGPAVAREHHAVSRQVAADRYLAADTFTADAFAGPVPYSSSCTHAPRVGAFATQPWTYESPCEPAAGYYSGY